MTIDLRALTIVLVTFYVVAMGQAVRAQPITTTTTQVRTR